MLQRKESLDYWWQFHGSPIFDRKNRDRVTNNNFEKGKGKPQFDFETFIANLIPGTVFRDFVPFGANFFPAEGFLSGQEYHFTNPKLKYEFGLVPNLSEKWNYNPNMFCFNKLCVCYVFCNVIFSVFFWNFHFEI